MVKNNVTIEERNELAIDSWKVRQAPSQSDIIWENLGVNDGWITIKTWTLNILLFFTCIVLVTPISLVDNMQRLLDAITEELEEENAFALML